MFVLNLDLESPKLVSVLYNNIDEGIGLPKTEGNEIFLCYSAS